MGDGRPHVEGDEGQERRRAPSSPTISTSASASRKCPRTARWPCCAAATRAFSTSISTCRTRPGKPHPAERQDHGRPSASPTAAAPPTSGWPRRRRLAWKTRLSHLAHRRPARAAQGARRRRGDSVFSKQPEGSAARGAGRPARHHGPRSRHPHRRQGRRGRSDRQGASTRRRSIRTSRATIGTARSRRWPRCASSTRSISSASATARPAARPTSSSPS